MVTSLNEYKVNSANYLQLDTSLLTEAGYCFHRTQNHDQMTTSLIPTFYVCLFQFVECLRHHPAATCQSKCVFERA